MAEAPTKQIKVPVGIVGVNVETIERTVGIDEPDGLPVNAETKVVGKPTPRIDGKLKVTGGAKYTADINLPGMLHARLITAAPPHAKVRSIDTAAAEKMPGVRAVHILDRVRGGAEADEQGEKYPRIRYAGQPIGAIAAETPQQAEDAVRKIKVDYELLPFVVDVEAAQQPDAPVIFSAPAEQAGTAGGGGGPRGVGQQGNVRGPSKGGTDGADIEKGFADADLIVEGQFSTQVQTHNALETHGLVADWRKDGLTVWCSTQGTGSVRDELAGVFGLKSSQVRCITEFMGGGFGAKFGAGNYGVLATHLSKKTGRPVKLMLDRKQEQLSVGNRPSSVQKYRIGAKKDGTLTAIHLQSHGTAGTGTGAGCAGPTMNLYPCPNIVTEESDVFINAGPAAAFRAPGFPQGTWGYEQMIDELAHKLDMDPIALRDKIDVEDARHAEADVRAAERKIGAERIGWSSRHAPAADPGPVKRGIGMAQSYWFRVVNEDSHCHVQLSRDGSVVVMSAVQDIGTGTRTALAQVVAEEFGIRASDVTVQIGDTLFPPGPPSGGSQTICSITPAARRAAYNVKQQLLSQIAAKQQGVSADDLSLADGKLTSRSKSDLTMTFTEAARQMRGSVISAVMSRGGDYGDAGDARPRRRAGGIGGVQFAAVAVDTETGIITVERVVAVHDCGRPINPLGVVNQINGGIIQGISYALYENRLLDRSTGVMVNPNLEQYKIAGSRETPAIDVVLVEDYWGKSSTDASGVGEPATVPTAAAIGNAVFNAIGVRVRDIPMTPNRVLAALKNKAENDGRSAQS